MARIFITGSSAGLGLMAAQLLISQSHEVVLHGRNQERANAALAAAPGAVAAVTGDLARLSEMRSVAGQVNRFGRFDAVIHNAGVGYREARRIETEDGFPHVFAINVLAPYILTALIERPERLVYLSSGMHYGAGPHLEDLLWTKRPWRGSEAYAESKLHDVLLAFAGARRWPDVRSNGTWMGPDPHGRSRCARRFEQGTPYAGVARNERRPARLVHGNVFLPSALARAQSCNA